MKLKHLADLVTTRVSAKPRPLLTLDAIASGTGQLAIAPPEGLAPDTGFADAEPGDVLFGKLRPYLAKVLLVDTPSYASTELLCLRPREQRAEPRWLRYAMLATPTVEFARATSDGTKMPRTSWQRLRELELQVPDPSVQRAVADLLDAETARIDTLIAKKRRLRVLLDERMRSLREAAFASSDGVRLKHVLSRRMAYGILVPRFTADGDGARMIRIGAITDGGSVRIDDSAWIEHSQSLEYQRTIVDPGDVVLSVVGSMGRSAVIDENSAGANLNRPLARLCPIPGLPPRLLWHWTQTRRFLGQAALATGGDTAQPTLNLGDLAEFEVGLPANPKLWPALLTDLERRLAPTNQLASLTDRQLVLLQEHRQALITAAVTGELEVPGVAA